MGPPEDQWLLKTSHFGTLMPFLRGPTQPEDGSLTSAAALWEVADHAISTKPGAIQFLILPTPALARTVAGTSFAE